MGPVDKDWTTRGMTSSQLILHEMVMTGNVQPKFPMEHNMKKRQKKRQKRQKKRQRQELNPGLPSYEHMHLPTRI